MSDIIKFSIKALIAGAIVWALYNHFSPLQNCLRMIESGGLELEQLEGAKLTEGIVSRLESSGLADRLELLGLGDLLETIESSDWLDGLEVDKALEGLGEQLKVRQSCLCQPNNLVISN